MDAADRDRLVAELRHELGTMARARSRLGVDPGQLPVLMGLVPDGGGRDELFGLVESGCRSLDSGIREAALALLADSDKRWNRNLKTRMTEAAQLIGIQSYHTFRDRSRVSGVSHYDELLTAVAEAVASATSGGTPVDTPEIPFQVVESTYPASADPRPGRPLRRHLIAAVTLVLTLAVAGVGLAGLRNSGPALLTRSSSSRQLAGCDIPLAATMDPAATPSGLLELMEQTFNAVGSTAGAGCPRHSVERWEDLWLQHLEGGAERPAGFVVVHPGTGTSLWAEQSLIETYRRTARGGLHQIDGHPIESGVLDGYHYIRLSLGGIIVAHAPGGPSFWAPGPARDAWIAAGGPKGRLGLPMTDVGFAGSVLHQDYEHGYLEEAAGGGVTATFVTSTDVERWFDHAAAAAEFPINEPSPGPDTVSWIVRSSDSTAWWIDANGIRRWIPDAEIWSCLGGDDRVLHQEMPGWVIAAFEPGVGPAIC